MRLTLPLAAALFMVMGCASDDAIPADPNQSFTFKLAPKVGSKYGFSFVSNSDGRTAEIVTTAEVKKADEKGVEFVQTVDTLKINGDENDTSVKTMRRMKVFITANQAGKVLDLKTENEPPGASPSDPPVYALPTGAVKVGDSWDGDLFMMGKRAKATYKLLGVVTQGGRQIANLEIAVTELPGVIFDGPVRGTLEVATGVPLTLKATVRAGAEGGGESVTSLEKNRIEK